MTLRPGSDGTSPVGRVYGGRGMAKSTNGNGQSWRIRWLKLPLSGTRETSA
jgi:hypothetical protein